MAGADGRLGPFPARRRLGAEPPARSVAASPRCRSRAVLRRPEPAMPADTGHHAPDTLPSALTTTRYPPICTVCVEKAADPLAVQNWTICSSGTQVSGWPRCRGISAASAPTCEPAEYISDMPVSRLVERPGCVGGPYGKFKPSYHQAVLSKSRCKSCTPSESPSFANARAAWRRSLTSSEPLRAKSLRVVRPTSSRYSARHEPRGVDHRSYMTRPEPSVA